MSLILDRLADHGRARPDAVALRGRDIQMSYAELHAAVRATAPLLNADRVGIWLDNVPAWAVADLALLQRGAVCVPVPEFFAPAQIRHLLHDAGVDAVLMRDPAPLEGVCRLQRIEPVRIAGENLAFCHIAPSPASTDLAGVAKVTYTSGTTASPKGVRLGAEAIERVAASLAEAIGASPCDRSLALTPLAILLENIGSLYAALLAGAGVTLVPMTEIGLCQAAGLDPGRLVTALQRYQPTCIIVPPQLLRALVESAESGASLPGSLRFVAVGGAPVARRMLERAGAVGLPVFEGYGLSEAASVVTLNRPGATRLGSVGRPLPHARVHVDARGEVHIGGALLQGYLHDRNVCAQDSWPSGDLGYIDEDGFLFLTGRRTNLFSTAYGRNVAPEWVERELLAHPAVLQAALFGEARPFNVAILVARPGAEVGALEAAVAEANRSLPEFAQVHRFAVADEPFGLGNGLLTGTGRLRRVQIEQRYGALIDSLYLEEDHAKLL